MTMLSGELIQVGTKTRNDQSLMERLFRYYLVSQRLNTRVFEILKVAMENKKRRSNNKKKQYIHGSKKFNLRR